MNDDQSNLNTSETHSHTTPENHDTYRISSYACAHPLPGWPNQQKIVVHCRLCEAKIFEVGVQSHHWLYGWKQELNEEYKCIAIKGTCRQCFHRHRIPTANLQDYMMRFGWDSEGVKAKLNGTIYELDDRAPSRQRGAVYPQDFFFESFVQGFDRMLFFALSGGNLETQNVFMIPPKEVDKEYWRNYRDVRIDLYWRIANYGFPLPERALKGFQSKYESLFFGDREFHAVLMRVYDFRAYKQNITLQPATRRLEKTELHMIFDMTR